MHKGVAVVAVITVLAGCSLSEKEAPNTRAIVDAAGPAPWRDDVVLHARLTWRDVGVEARVEEWVDTRTGATRSVTYDPSGIRTIRIHRRGVLGNVVVGPHGRRRTETSVRLVAGDRRLEDASVVRSFWRKLARAGATIIDDDEVDGRRVMGRRGAARAVQ